MLDLDKNFKPYRDVAKAAEKFLTGEVTPTSVIRLYKTMPAFWIFLLPGGGSKSVIETTSTKYVARDKELFVVALTHGILRKVFEELPLDLQMPFQLFIDGNSLYDVAIMTNMAGSYEVAKARASQKIYKAVSIMVRRFKKILSEKDVTVVDKTSKRRYNGVRMGKL